MGLYTHAHANKVLHPTAPIQRLWEEASCLYKSQEGVEKINHLYTHRERFFWSQRKEEVGWGGGVLVGEQLAPNIQEVVVLQIRATR